MAATEVTTGTQLLHHFNLVSLFLVDMCWSVGLVGCYEGYREWVVEKEGKAQHSPRKPLPSSVTRPATLCIIGLDQ